MPTSADGSTARRLLPGDRLLLVHNPGIYCEIPSRRRRRGLPLTLEDDPGREPRIRRSSDAPRPSGDARRPFRADRHGRLSGRISRRDRRGKLRRLEGRDGQPRRCLARNEGPRGITANSICPGWVDTEMARPDVAARRAEIEAEVPLGRIATPEDCARAILFYLSPLAPYANGTALGPQRRLFHHDTPPGAARR